MSVATYREGAEVRSFPTNANFASSRYRAVRGTGTDTDVIVNGASKPSGLLSVNVADYSSETDGRVDVVTRGPAVGVADAAIAFDVPVMATTLGRLTTGTDGNWCLGFSKGTPAAQGEEFEVEINPFFLETT